MFVNVNLCESSFAKGSDILWKSHLCACRVEC